MIDAHGIDRIHLPTLAFEVFAGSRLAAGAVDGTGLAARFNDPQGLTTDGTNLFVADTGNDTIRKIVIATGVVTTIAGVAGQSGALDGVGMAARFFRPFGITTNGASLWITDRGAYTVRKLVLSTASVTTVAGSPLQPGTADGTGAAARFSSLEGIVREGPNLWIADADRVRRLVPSTGAVSTAAALRCTVLWRRAAPRHHLRRRPHLRRPGLLRRRERLHRAPRGGPGHRRVDPVARVPRSPSAWPQMAPTST